MRNEELAAQFGRRTDQLRLKVKPRPLSHAELAAAAGLSADFIRRVLGGEHDVRISTLLKLGRALGLELRRTKRDPKTGQVIEPQCLCALLEPADRVPIGDRAKSAPVILDRMHALEAKETR